MAVINNVSYPEMPAKAGELREAGLTLNRDVIQVYNEINEMKTHWKGTRYNGLATSFNDMRPLFNSILGLVVGTFPTTVEQVANNYAVVDTGDKICNVTEEPVMTIPDVTPTEPNEFRFIQSEVESIKTRVFDYFKAMIDEMQNIQSIMNSIPWDSDAATTFRETFEQLKGQILHRIEEVQSKFDANMAQTIADVQAGENANQGQANG